jgi:dTDP-4-dehydrorhamnose 3,5-epimerase-like enzyme
MEEVALHGDARGFVLEPLPGDEPRCQGNVHVVLTLPGEVRGNHHHLKGTETVVVLGPALVRHGEDGRIVDTRVPDGRALRLRFPPCVPHAIQCTGGEPGILVAFSTEPRDPSSPDTARFPLID